MKKAKPHPPPRYAPEPEGTYAGGFGATLIEPVTKCKHGVGDCETCGTYDRTDKRHSTVNGSGSVARLRRKP